MSSDDIWNAAADTIDAGRAQGRLRDEPFATDLPGLHLAMYALGNGKLAEREDGWCDPAVCGDCGTAREPLDRLFGMCENGCDDEELSCE